MNSKNITVRDLIFELNKKLGRNFGNLIVNKELNEINPEILIFVNDKEIQTLQKLETILTDGNYIAFVSAIHGGFTEN